MLSLSEDILIYQLNSHLRNRDVISLLSVNKDLNKLRSRVLFYETKNLLPIDREMWYYDNLRSVHFSHDCESWGPLPKNLHTIYLSVRSKLCGILHEGIKKIFLADNFNQSIQNQIPKSVTHFYTGKQFNQPINFSSLKNLKILILRSEFDQPLNNCLPEGLRYLLLFGCKSFSLKGCVPKTVERLVIGITHLHDLEGCIPMGVISLSAPGPINNLARDCPNIKRLCYRKLKNKRTFLMAGDIPRSVVSLSLHRFKECDENIIPEGVENLTISAGCTTINIPKSVKKLELRKPLSSNLFRPVKIDSVKIPENVVELIIHSDLLATQLIPKSVKTLKIIGTNSLLVSKK